MKIIITNTSTLPIYEQIASQIRNQIINGELVGDYQLPSIRALAKELQVSVITTKRAYEELERDGFIQTVAGKGTYVSNQNMALIREHKIRDLEKKISQLLQLADDLGLTYKEVRDMMDLLAEED
ncbi:GntR family transcriptional regulator [Listeria newyorkensis]|uniref:GntR family transcriptional regulator n=1 Tax=Listeria newyorkensis TaxID=1497681 RepID=A0ABX4XLC9_9LIST|nr:MULTISPECIES: GntR family transcriptional regulator [Listeria]KGL46894.1 GntR family transcriptional regulator [Listeriaceae bacterium FSL A5-0209]KGL39234.1 GntR family transcriptional regulator [Listeria newyorkensis]KMT58149.1 regulatory protein GntR HTH [Listeria newyorkensis]PNP91918.1 GntR family transcriptional regulator [Listeria newyorkensis]RQW66173.1 GntR family transcriptional regulator [Listeria sp. SHR_NRA_18]